MRVLAIDTAAGRCAAAVVVDGATVSERSETMARGHAERLFPLIDDALAAAGLSAGDLDRIAVCAGPGGFTGARIGVAAARGLALALGRPAIGVDLFEAAAEGSSGAVLARLAQSRGVAIRRFRDGRAEGAARLCDADDPLAAPRAGERVIAVGEADLAALARVAEAAAPGPRPAPLYLRPPDAALPARGPAPLLP